MKIIKFFWGTYLIAGLILLFTDEIELPHLPEFKIEINHNPIIGYEPVQPIQPVQPVDPVQPVQPVQPVDPVDPVDPIKPLSRVDSVKSFH